ncbi:MAG: hypothetical protein AYL30_000410 [Candidatus Hecatellales archaeon B24]|nr:MAG: hypothetical protein AYL30_000410 [Candidatus Hecatellales archaeon B24]
MAGISRIPVRILLEGVGETAGELIRFWAPRTVEAVVKALPLEGKAALWPGEIYFPVSLRMGLEKAKAVVEAGTIAYWPQGSALCLFYAQTKPYSPVNPIGKITGSLEPLKKTGRGTIIKMEKTESSG